MPISQGAFLLLAGREFGLDGIVVVVLELARVVLQVVEELYISESIFQGHFAYTRVYKEYFT